MTKTYTEHQIRRLVLFGIILFGIVEVAFFRLVFPASFTCYLLLIPIYFLISGIFILLLLTRIRRRRLHPGRAVARLMLFNVVQMALSFIILFLYYYFVNIHRYTMLIAFSLFYVYFMGIKYFILYNIEKHHKFKNDPITKQL